MSSLLVLAVNKVVCDATLLHSEPLMRPLRDLGGLGYGSGGT